MTDKVFTLWDYETDRPITELDITASGDWPHWLAWLDRPDVKRFRYVRGDGATCTVTKEMRAHFGNKEDKRPVWYAEKRINFKRRRRYLGKSENLTYDRLRQVALDLAQMKLF